MKYFSKPYKVLNVFSEIENNVSTQYVNNLTCKGNNVNYFILKNTNFVTNKLLRNSIIFVCFDAVNGGQVDNHIANNNNRNFFVYSSEESGGS